MFVFLLARTNVFVYDGRMSPNHKALARAIKAAKPGTQTGLAKAIGTSQAAVGYWLNKSQRGAPGEWVILIEKATGVSRHDLRPDLYPRSIRKACRQQTAAHQ